MKKFETNRLIIKPLTQSMAHDLYEAITDSLDVFQLWFDWANPEPSLQDVVERTKKNIKLQAAKEAFFFSIYMKDTGEFVGRLSFDKLQPNVPSFNFAGWCKKVYIGKGYMGEAARVLLKWAIHDYKCQRIESYHDVENEQSKRAIQLLVREFGFKYQGVIKNAERRIYDNTLRSHALYAYTPET